MEKEEFIKLFDKLSLKEKHRLMFLYRGKEVSFRNIYLELKFRNKDKLFKVANKRGLFDQLNKR